MSTSIHRRGSCATRPAAQLRLRNAMLGGMWQSEWGKWEEAPTDPRPPGLHSGVQEHRDSQGALRVACRRQTATNIAAGQYRRIQGVLYDDYVQAHAVVVPGPPLEHGCSQRGQIVLKMAMSLEDRSEEVGHGEHNADKGNIRQCGSLFSLPELGASIAAARATIRFAGVIEDLLTGRGGVNF